MAQKRDIVLANVINQTTKGTYELSSYDTSHYKEAEYILDVTALTETGGSNAITLDVKIQSYYPATGKWKDVVIFDQVSVTGATTTSTQHKIATTGLGTKQRVVYTLGGDGTVGDCDFRVEVVYWE